MLWCFFYEISVEHYLDECYSEAEYILNIIRKLVLSWKKTQRFSITNISWSILFKDVITLYFENHMKSINTLCGKMQNYLSLKQWCIELPLGFKGLQEPGISVV
jgi:hypothetical protein